MAMLLPQVLRSGSAPVRLARWWPAAAGLVAVMLASGVGYWMLWPVPSSPALTAPQPRTALSALAPSARHALAECGESAMLLHDVRWAAACMLLAQQDETRDGSTDCELPPAHAARLNALLDRAEQRCLADAGQRRP